MVLYSLGITKGNSYTKPVKSSYIGVNMKGYTYTVYKVILNE